MDWRDKLKEMTRLEDEDESEKWHAIFVRSGYEDPVKQKIEYALRDSGISAVVPKRSIMERKTGQWHERIKPLFPGYILLQGQIDIPDYYILRTVPGIVRILKDNNGLYRIYSEEIKVINRLMCNGEIIGESTGFKLGDSIVITNGPLLNMEGLITAIDHRKGRAKVKLNFLGDECTIDLSIKIIKTA